MIQHHFGGGVYAKETCLPAGSWAVQHAHKFDHLSVLASGKVELTVGNTTTTHEAPACLTIAAGKVHSVLALTDIVWYCIHATDCTNVEAVDGVLIEEH